MKTMPRTYGGHVEDIWRTCGGHMKTMPRTYGGHVEDIWRTCGGHMKTMPRTYGGHVEDMPDWPDWSLGKAHLGRFPGGIPVGSPAPIVS